MRLIFDALASLSLPPQSLLLLLWGWARWIARQNRLTLAPLAATPLYMPTL